MDFTCANFLNTRVSGEDRALSPKLEREVAFDPIILDPPAFTKTRDKVQLCVAIEINAAAVACEVATWPLVLVYFMTRVAEQRCQLTIPTCSSNKLKSDPASSQTQFFGVFPEVTTLISSFFQVV